MNTYRGTVQYKHDGALRSKSYDTEAATPEAAVSNLRAQFDAEGIAADSVFVDLDHQNTHLKNNVTYREYLDGSDLREVYQDGFMVGQYKTERGALRRIAALTK
jgi:hypothetical protein